MFEGVAPSFAWRSSALRWRTARLGSAPGKSACIFWKVGEASGGERPSQEKTPATGLLSLTGYGSGRARLFVVMTSSFSSASQSVSASRHCFLRDSVKERLFRVVSRRRKYKAAATAAVQPAATTSDVLDITPNQNDLIAAKMPTSWRPVSTYS